MKELTKGDKLLILFIIAVNVLALIFINQSLFGEEDKYISIQVNGEEIKTILFSEDMIGKTIPIETEYGYNLIEIGDGKVRAIDGDCHDHLCVKQGYISKVGEVIVCLPNRLVVEIKGTTQETEIDGISR